MPHRPPKHEPPNHKTYAQERSSAHQKGYGVRWRRARIAWLGDNPLCVTCLALGKTTAAWVVDHIIPHKGDTALFWDSDNNWQSLCETHHNQKTARENRPT